MSNILFVFVLRCVPVWTTCATDHVVQVFLIKCLDATFRLAQPFVIYSNLCQHCDNMVFFPRFKHYCSEILIMTPTLCVNLISCPNAIIQSLGNIYNVSMMQFACKQHLLVLIGIYRVQVKAILNKSELFLHLRSLSAKPQCEQFQNKM